MSEGEEKPEGEGEQLSKIAEFLSNRRFKMTTACIGLIKLVTISNVAL